MDPRTPCFHQASISRLAFAAALLVVTGTGCAGSGSVSAMPNAATEPKILYFGVGPRMGAAWQLDIFLATGNDFRVKNITNSRSIEYDPCFSPTGARIAFAVIASKYSDKSDIVLMNGDGTGREQITASEPGILTGSPEWSPDGGKIAYFTLKLHDYYRGKFTPLLYVYDLKAKQTTTLGPGAFPSWASDGKRILITRPLPGGDKGGLFTIKPDGSGEKRFIKDPATMGVWSPDGRYVAYTIRSEYVEGRTKDGGLFICDAQGANRRLLVKNEDLASVFGPRWAGKNSISYTRVNTYGLPVSLHMIDIDRSTAQPVTVTSGGASQSGGTFLVALGLETQLRTAPAEPGGKE